MRIIAGELRGRILKAPKGQNTRPTQSALRGSLFNMCQSWIEGVSVLDLFSGSGALGIEALSRGARYAVFVDSDMKAVRVIQENIAQLGLEARSLILHLPFERAIDLLQKKQQAFELVFIDPPYSDEGSTESLSYRALEKIFNSTLITSNSEIFVEEGHSDLPVIVQQEGQNICELKSKRRFGGSWLYAFQPKKTFKEV